jgi:hypothetical protein
MTRILPTVVNEFQTVFVDGRHISDNGWSLQTLMAHCRQRNPNASQVEMLFDQEKAYDRIYLDYLS